jgi:hypothetical protein
MGAGSVKATEKASGNPQCRGIVYEDGRGGAHEYPKPAPGKHPPQPLANTLQSSGFKVDLRDVGNVDNGSAVARRQAPRGIARFSPRTGST